MMVLSNHNISFIVGRMRYHRETPFRFTVWPSARASRKLPHCHQQMMQQQLNMDTSSMCHGRWMRRISSKMSWARNAHTYKDFQKDISDNASRLVGGRAKSVLEKSHGTDAPLALFDTLMPDAKDRAVLRSVPAKLVDLFAALQGTRQCDKMEGGQGARPIPPRRVRFQKCRSGFNY